MSDPTDPFDYPTLCPTPDCITIGGQPLPSDQPPGQYPQPYYPGYDLPDETPPFSTPATPPQRTTPAGGPGKPPARPPMGQPSPVKPRPEPQVPAPKYVSAQIANLFEQEPAVAPFGFSNLPKPSLLDPQFSFGSTLGDIPGYVDLSGTVLADPGAIPQTFPAFAPTAPAPGQLTLFETPTAAEVFAKPSLLGALSGALSDVFDVGTFVNRAITTVLSLGAVGRVLNPLALLMQTTEAGFPPGVEEAIVAARLTRPAPPPGFEPIAPVVLPDAPGLLAPTLEPTPSAPLETVVVSAPRATNPLLADTLLGLNPVLLGIGEVPTLVPGVVPTGAPRTRARPSTTPRPREQSPTLTRPAIPTVPQRPVETLPFGGPQPRLGQRPGQRPGATPYPQPKPSPQPDPLDSSANKLCPKTKPPKKKQQKKQPRTICYRGTYTELRSGLIKHRKERIPCQ